MNEEQKKRIEEIMAGMECEKDFECYKSGFERICKAEDIGLLEHAKCLEEIQTICKFKIPYRDEVFCSCPLRVYVARELNI